MTDENLTYYEPTEAQLTKFHQTNEMPEWVWEMICMDYNDCSTCPVAIHQWLLSTEKHTCTRGITEEKFRALMSSADCEY